MRVTTRMMVTNSLRRLSNRLEDYEATQERLATGRRINRTSDDPSGAARALTLRSSLRARTQEVRNADDALAHLNRADSEMQGVLTTLHRVKDLALRANSDLGPTERNAVALELEQLRGNLEGIANATTGNRPLFAGTSAGPAVQQVAGVWTYTGDTGDVERRVTEQDRVVVNTTAEKVFGFGSAQGDTFTIIDDLVTALGADDAAGMQASLNRIDASFAGVTEQLAVIGATTNRVENARVRTESGILTVKGELSEVQDMEFEEAIMDLQVEEVAYEATLAALGRSLPDSLVSFLR